MRGLSSFDTPLLGLGPGKGGGGDSSLSIDWLLALIRPIEGRALGIGDTGDVSSFRENRLDTLALDILALDL
jgi:hypothetical protein